MLFTLADARSGVSRFVESGTCNVSVIDARINEAVARILDMEDWECLRKVMRLAVVDGNIGLPSSVEKLLWAAVDGTPVRIFGKPYQFLSSGPGDLDFSEGSTLLKNLQDLGDNWSTVYEIPDTYLDNTAAQAAQAASILAAEAAASNPSDEALALAANQAAQAALVAAEGVTTAGLSLYAFGSSTADLSKTITVRCANARDEQLTVEVPINRWSDGAEGVIRGPFSGAMAPGTSEVTSVLRVTKPATTGYVSLFAVDVPRKIMFFLAKYAPGDTLPQFRRYSVIGAGVPKEQCLLAVARLRYVPLVDPEDIVPIDSLPALKFMVMAIREENTGNVQGSMNFEGKAKMSMENRQQANTMATGTQVVIDFDYSLSLGRAMNNGIIL